MMKVSLTATTIFKAGRVRTAIRRARLVTVAVVCLWSVVILAFGSVAASGRRGVAAHDACSTPNSAKVPCHFSTPSGNIRCLWTPSPNMVECVLRATGRAYRLRPTGHARAIKLKLARRGQTLPTTQQIVFPQSLSCRDTRTMMICNQDFGTGEFKLAPKGSHGS
jgi:hypothetical protein